MKEKLQVKAKEILAEQKKANEEWGKTFNEQCYRYETEWRNIYEDNEKQ